MARRPIAVLSLSALFVTALTVPAHADSFANLGCTVAPGDQTLSSADRSTVRASTPHTSAVLAPSLGSITGTSDLTWVDADDGCGVLASTTDRLRVQAPGIAAGTPVSVRATVRTFGSLLVTGAAGSAADAELQGTYSAYGLGQDCRDGCIPLLSAYVRGAAQRGEQAPDGAASWSWQVGTAEAVQQDSGGATTGSTVFDSGTRTVDVLVPAGEVLLVDSRLNWLSSVHDATTRAAVDTGVTVTWSGLTPGVQVVPDGQQAPEPPATPLERVQAARDLLASYDVHHGVRQALDVKLERAERALLTGTDACPALRDVLAQLEAQRGKKLTGEQVDALRAELDAAATALGC